MLRIDQTPKGKATGRSGAFFRLLRSGRQRCSGFTFVELLAICFTIGFLAVLVTPVVARARQKARQATCTTNLRQLGRALQLYAEANHDFLPGPVSALAQAGYDKRSKDELIWFLAEYLGGPKPSRKLVVAETLLCPARSDRQSDPVTPKGPASYVLNTSVKTSEGPVYPFGRPAEPDSGPLRFERLAACAPPARTIAMTDADKANVNPTLGGWRSLPSRPIHGEWRNQLFFDGHVAEQPR